MKNKKQLAIAIIVWIFCIMIFSYNMKKSGNDYYAANVVEKQITYGDFVKALNNGEINKVKIFNNDIIALTNEIDGTVYRYEAIRVSDPNLVDRLIEQDVDFEHASNTGTTIFNVILSFAPMLIILYIFSKGMGGSSGIMSIGKAKTKDYVEKDTGIKFDDVAGEDEAKESLTELVDFLHNPEKYRTIGAKLPKGALLVGPPGTGKTLLAKAVAGEAHVPFYSISGSDFVEMFVGVGAARVRDLFEKANKNAPCIIFIDEIDAIGKKRDGGSHGNDEREQTLNQLLSEMDGFDPQKGIIVLGATNRPESLDAALLRPGRFDRRVIVEKPDLKGRIDILNVHSKNVLLDETVDMKGVALATAGVSGADLANIVNEAAILAIKNDRTAVSQKDLLEAVEIVLVGKEKKDRVLSEEEKKIVAYHEIGHALATAVQKHTEPVQKITIIPRTMGALGFVMQTPEKEKFLNTKEELEEQIVIALAGRAAEEVFFHTVTTGAANDIEKATAIAKAMITQYGMSDKFGLAGFATVENRYLSGNTVLNCGDITAAAIDDEIVKILKDSYDKAKSIVLDHKETMKDLAEFLINKETITGKEFMEIYENVIAK